jgi:Protein of unknown function (DUF4058)
MRSPFPGMDPYIEVCHLWDDFHHDLISEIKNALAPVLPKRYVVRAGERSYVALTAKNGEDEYRMQADVTVAQKPGIEQASVRPAAAAVLEAGDAESAPLTMRALVQTEFHEGFLEIRETYGERQVVTSIEILSPSNKRFGSEGWFEYLRKRRACLSGLVNFVEIDLLRRGRRLPMDDEWPDSPYYLLVCRRAEVPRCTVWRAYCTRPLPPISIPLLPPDADVALALQPLIDAIYARSQYDVDIDYRQPPYPSLTTAEAAWLEERLRERQGPGKLA